MGIKFLLTLHKNYGIILMDFEIYNTTKRIFFDNLTHLINRTVIPLSLSVILKKIMFFDLWKLDI